MNNPLQDLYQEVILDHNRSPRNFRKIEGATHTAEGFNPLCGDRLNLYLNVKDGVIDDIAFEGSGCAISKASASLMGSVLKGKSIAQAHAMFKNFHAMVTSKFDDAPDTEALGKLAVFSGVREFPTRVKCAILAWHALEAALTNEHQPVSTE